MPLITAKSGGTKSSPKPIYNSAASDSMKVRNSAFHRQESSPIDIPTGRSVRVMQFVKAYHTIQSTKFYT